MTSGSNYMGTGFAKTLDQGKPIGNLQIGNGLQGAASATSLTLSNYAVPSLDGKLIPAIPIKLALKNTPPTLAVVYQMKDAKTGRMKKYIHEIRINFEKEEKNKEIDVNRMCDEICRKETTYLNPAYISRQQVMQLLRKLHQTYQAKKDTKAPMGSKDDAKQQDSKNDQDTNGTDPAKGRKPNFFERKRFLNYENEWDNEDQDDGAKDAQNKNAAPGVTKEIKDGSIVQKEEPPKPAAITEIFEEEETVVVSKSKNKSKPAEVRSAAPPKNKAKEDTKLEQLQLDDPKKSKETDKSKKKDKTESDPDNYSDDWGNDDFELEDKGDVKKMDNKKPDLMLDQPPKNDLGVPKLNDDFFNVKEDPILGNQPDMKKEESNDDFFKDEFNDLDLENEFNNNQMFPGADPKKNNPFGQSITKELLQQSKKEIEKEGLSDILDNDSNNLFDNNGLGQNDQEKSKKGLHIEIDENANIAEQDDQAQQMLLENVMKNENKMSDDEQQMQNMVPGGQQMDDDDDDEQYTEEGIIQQFDEIYSSDPALQQLLGDQPTSYSVEEKLSIIQAYKKGGGVQGLAEIIDDDDEDDAQQELGGLPPDFDPNQQQLPDGMQYAEQEEGDEEEMDIDLENPEDVKIIENEFQKLYENEEKFKNDFGEEMFELSPLQKYQIIDAYNKNGMDAVMALLNNSVDQSQNASAMMQQMDMHGQLDAEESVIEHEGKRYTRIQIEGLRDDDDEYLMDEQQNIYSLDFKFITNMGEHQIEADDDGL